jgi:carbonic anhydrase
MKFWRFEINWITPEKENAVVFEPLKFPVHIETKQVKALKKAKDENQKPKRTTKARKVTKSS